MLHTFHEHMSIEITSHRCIHTSEEVLASLEWLSLPPPSPSSSSSSSSDVDEDDVVDGCDTISSDDWMLATSDTGTSSDNGSLMIDFSRMWRCSIARSMFSRELSTDVVDGRMDEDFSVARCSRRAGGGALLLSSLALGVLALLSIVSSPTSWISRWAASRCLRCCCCTTTRASHF